MLVSPMLYLEKHIIRLNEILALSALLQAGSENVGPNTIEECIEKLDRYAFPEDYVDEVENSDMSILFESEVIDDAD